MSNENMKRLSEFEQSISAIRDGSKFLIEAAPHFAKLYKSYFLALKKEGFTDEQALYLIAQHGPLLGFKNQ